MRNNNNNNNSRDEYGSGTKSVTINGQEVTAVRKDENYNVLDFQLADGSVLDYNKAVSAIKSGNATGLIVQSGNEGQTVIRSSPDGDPSNNLDQLPTFE